MESIKQALFSGNIFAWVIIFLILILFLKFLKNAGKGLVIFLAIVVLFGLLMHFFPDVLAPAIHFVSGGWMGG